MFRLSCRILKWAALAAAPAVAPASTAREYYDGVAQALMLSQNGGAYSPVGTLANVGWTRDSGTSTVRLTTATDTVSIGNAAAPANTKFYIRGTDGAVVTAQFDRRLAQGADVLTVTDAQTALVVVAVDDNGNLSLRRSATAAGSDSRELQLAGQTNTSTRTIGILNEADAGADDYRLRINDHAGAAWVFFDRNGTAAERRTRIQATLALEGVLTPAVINANANNVATAGASVLRQDTSGNFNVSGFADGYDGKILYFQNISNVAGATNQITLTNEDAASNASNRIRTPNNANMVVRNNGGVVLRYVGSISRWTVLSAAL